MQVFYNLSDPTMEDALYEIESMHHLAGLKLDRLPDETSLLKFRHCARNTWGSRVTAPVFHSMSGKQANIDKEREKSV